MKLDLKALLSKLTEAAKEPTGYGSSVLLTSYTSASNQYTIPSNGVVKIFCTYRANNYIIAHVLNSDGTNDVSIQSSTPTNLIGNLLQVIPVFKGQKVWIQTNNTSYNYGEFIPYIY